MIFFFLKKLIYTILNNSINSINSLFKSFLTFFQVKICYKNRESLYKNRDSLFLIFQNIWKTVELHLPTRGKRLNLGTMNFHDDFPFFSVKNWNFWIIPVYWINEWCFSYLINSNGIKWFKLRHLKHSHKIAMNHSCQPCL